MPHQNLGVSSRLDTPSLGATRTLGVREATDNPSAPARVEGAWHQHAATWSGTRELLLELKRNSTTYIETQGPKGATKGKLGGKQVTDYPVGSPSLVVPNTTDACGQWTVLHESKCLARLPVP